MFKKSFLYLVILSTLMSSGCFIKGRVINENGNGLSGVTVILSGAASMSTTTDSDGYYQFGDLDNPLSEGSYTVTPSISQSNIIPPNKHVTLAIPPSESVPWPAIGVDFEAIELEMYDDFDSGTINPSLWYIDAVSGTISIESGELKIVLNSGFPDVGCNLVMMNSPETIKAIFAEIRIVSYTGDAIADIWGFQGKIQNNFVVNQQGLLPQQQIIVGVLMELDQTKSFLKNICSGALGYEALVGNTHTIGTTFAGFKATPQEGFWYAQNYGMDTFFSLENITPPTPDIGFKGIGAVSPSGGGTCVAYFDNIRVLR